VCVCVCVRIYCACACEQTNLALISRRVSLLLQVEDTMESMLDVLDKVVTKSGQHTTTLLHHSTSTLTHSNIGHSTTNILAKNAIAYGDQIHSGYSLLFFFALSLSIDSLSVVDPPAPGHRRLTSLFRLFSLVLSLSHFPRACSLSLPTPTHSRLALARCFSRGLPTAWPDLTLN
jgi:hypothetical protein